MEQSIAGGDTSLTEASISDKLEEFRSKQKDFVSLSFDTIAGSGPNGAIIHYHPTHENCAKINKDAVFLLDSGGQYKDGTTDVTRTMHFGTPTKHEKRCFTRVLQGHIGLATAVFPKGTTGSKLDVLARLPLWSDGLDYQHGTGHGVGAFLNVHEGPQGISSRENTTAFQPGMTITNEPGYYEANAFGIRIENVMAVKEVEPLHRFPADQQYFGFEALTLVPIQKKLIDWELLSKQEKEWINDYHRECREKVGPLLSGVHEKEWFDKATEAFTA